jgi:hypothetical protein
VTGPENPPNAPLSTAGWIAIIVMMALLAWALWYSVHAFAAMRGVHMSVLGWVFLTLGAIVTFLVGAGLMGLVFYSSRHDMDR